MKHSEIIEIYNNHKVLGNKLQAVKFIKDLANLCQPKYDLGLSYGSAIRLKEAKDMMDNCEDGVALLNSLKQNFPKIYKKLNLIKYAR